MGTNQEKMSTVFSAVASIVVTFFAAYILLLILTLGSTHVSGLYVSMEFVKVGIVGFLVAIIFSSRLKKVMLMLLAVVVNIASELIQELLIGTKSHEKIGETTVVYHQKVETSIIDFGEITLVVIVSIALISIFFWIRQLMVKNRIAD